MLSSAAAVHSQGFLLRDGDTAGPYCVFLYVLVATDWATLAACTLYELTQEARAVWVSECART